MNDHILLCFCHVFKVNHDNVFEVRYSIVLEQLHLHLKDKIIDITFLLINLVANLDHFRNFLKVVLIILHFLFPLSDLLYGAPHL